ncbi:MAG: alpha-ketoacid dehydrogenase subunit beta [Sulfobacillus acidophilus]|uniref:Alpha-ketoacid dehydrogenase subunit beta n=1 Tax=Sulfobacillus acidophilus TaxID=53633 RepID=A0A2T2WHJ5_9FIRM|nr:MAG: alpha-ketoacid dehydrogenase subunit beta [Sulfobacillus acidophilus]
MAELSFGRAFAKGLSEEMARDPNIVVLGTDILMRGGHFGQVAGLGEQFGPTRVIDTPISEAGLVSLGMGAALLGLRPIVDLNFQDFMLGAMDELINQVAKWSYMSDGRLRVPLVIRASDGAAHGAGPQHSQSLEGWIASTPGLRVVVPSTPADVTGLLKTVLRQDDPVLFFMHKMLSAIKGEVPDEDVVIPLGQAAVRRAGDDVTIIAYGIMTSYALQAADSLAIEGISADVIDLRTLSPLDVQTVVTSVKRTSRAVVVHQAPTFGGFGGELTSIIQEQAFDYLDAPVVRVGARHTPVPVASILQEAVIPNVSDIVQAVKSIC